jgi:hypothetical protein
MSDAAEAVMARVHLVMDEESMRRVIINVISLYP